MRPRVIPARRYPLGVLVRLTGALVAALALLTALPAGAAAQLSREPQKVYDDYRSDAAIEPCDHTVAAYRRTLREITPDIEEETPAFRPAVEAARRERERGRQDCLAQDSPTQPGTDGDNDDGDGAAGGSAGGTTPSPPAQSAPPAPSPEPAQPATPATGARRRERPRPRPRPPRRRRVAPPPPVADSAPPAAAAPVLLNQPHDGTPVGAPDRARAARAERAAGRAAPCSRGASAGARSGSRDRAMPGARRPTAPAQRGRISSTGSASAAVRTVYNPLG